MQYLGDLPKNLILGCVNHVPEEFTQSGKCLEYEIQWSIASEPGIPLQGWRKGMRPMQR